MIQVCLLLFIAGLTFGGAGVNWWRETLQKAEESKRIAAEQKLAEQTAKAVEEGKNKLIDMQAAFEAGEQSVKVKERIVVQKVREYVTNNPALNNPVCTITDADLLRQLNGQIAAVRAAAAALDSIGAMPSAGTDPRQGAQGVGPPAAVSGQPATATGLHPETAKPTRADGVPGQGMQRPPKPQPIN